MKMPSLPALSLLLAAAAPLALPVAHAAEVQIMAQNPVVELSTMETVPAAPDTAFINAGVTTRGATAVEAMRLNAQQMERVIARLIALGVPRNRIQTSGLGLNAQYQYNNEGEPPRFLGYDVSNTVTVKLRDTAKIGEVLDALVEAGATNLNGPNFSVEMDTELKEQARKAAFERAQAQAANYARLAGYSGVKLIEISELQQNFGPMPVSMNLAQDARASTPIEPGQVGVGVQLTTKWEMTR